MVIPPPPPDRMRSVTELGLWWVPSKPEAQVSGTLRFDGVGEPRLELIGMLREQARGTAQDFDLPVILGRTTTGAHVALLGCHDVGTRGGAGPLRAATVEASLAILGAHYEAAEAVRFRSLTVAYDQLDEWASFRGLALDEEWEDDGRLRTIRVTYNHPEPKTATVGDLALVLMTRHFRQATGHRRAEIAQTAVVKITPGEAMHVDRYRAVLGTLQNFLTLGVGLPVYPTAVHAKPWLEAPIADARERRRAEGHTLELLYSPGRRAAPFQRRLRDLMLFSLRDVADDVERCLVHWFRDAERLKTVHDLYFATMYGSSMYGETRFLLLAQAVELYHRLTGARHALDPGAFEVIRERLRAVIDDPTVTMPDETRKLFRNRLDTFNELGLAARVREVHARGGEAASLLIPDRGPFVSAVRDTRNYLTHYSKPAKKNRVADTPAALFPLTEQVRALLEVSFLRELGMPESLQRELVARTRWMRHF